MSKKKTGFYNAIYWLVNNPGATAYEVARGIEFDDAWRVYEWLVLAERQSMVTRHRRGGEITPRWSANVSVSE